MPIEVITISSDEEDDFEEAGKRGNAIGLAQAESSARTRSDPPLDARRSNGGAHIPQANMKSPPMQAPHHSSELLGPRPSENLQSYVSEDLGARASSIMPHFQHRPLPPTAAQQVAARGMATGPVHLKPVHMPAIRSPGHSQRDNHTVQAAKSAGSGSEGIPAISRPNDLKKANGATDNSTGIEAAAGSITQSLYTSNSNEDGEGEGSILVQDEVGVEDPDGKGEDIEEGPRGETGSKRSVDLFQKKKSRELGNLLLYHENSTNPNDGDQEGDIAAPRKRQKTNCVKMSSGGPYAAAANDGGRDKRGGGGGGGGGRTGGRKGRGRPSKDQQPDQSAQSTWQQPVHEQRFPSELARAWAKLYTPSPPDREECWPKSASGQGCGLIQGRRIRVLGLHLSPEVTLWFEAVKDTFMSHLDSVGMLDMAYSVRPAGMNLLTYKPNTDECVNLFSKDGRSKSKRCPSRTPFLEIMEDLIVAIVAREIQSSDPTWREICTNLPSSLPTHPLVTSYVIPPEDPRVALRGQHGVMYKGRGMTAYVRETRGMRESDLVSSCIAHGACECPFIGVYDGDLMFRKEYNVFKIKPPPWFVRHYAPAQGMEVTRVEWESEVNAYAVDLQNGDDFEAKALTSDMIEAASRMEIDVSSLVDSISSIKRNPNSNDLCFTVSAYPPPHVNLKIPDACIRGNITSVLNDPHGPGDDGDTKEIEKALRKTLNITVRIFGLLINERSCAGGFPMQVQVSEGDTFKIGGQDWGELHYDYGREYWDTLEESKTRLEVLKAELELA